MSLVLDPPLFDALARLARRDGTSLSTKARELLREALERHEDLGLAEIAVRRERTLNRAETVSHDAVWRRSHRSEPR